MQMLPKQVEQSNAGIEQQIVLLAVDREGTANRASGLGAGLRIGRQHRRYTSREHNQEVTAANISQFQFALQSEV